MLNANTMMASLWWGLVAFGCIIYGKKQSEATPLIAGFVLLAISYFVGSALLMSLASVAVVATMVYLARHGY